ncbi:MAG: fumarylacetoacetate hydrolase family protein [Chloroflexi bacterium]|nr:fumarylacetoacetate hydrolase family protein [Chloroflexota bacterium]
MKLVSFRNSNCQQRLGLIVNERVYDMQSSAAGLGFEMPSNMNIFLEGGNQMMDAARKVEAAVDQITPEETALLLSPVPKPISCRDAYAFRQHVATARKNRGVEMIPEFDQFPVFYFTNHNSIIGSGDLVVELDHLEKLDFELEAAIVIGRKGRNISVSEADAYIAGFTIMNDFSARLLQMEEMRLNLGPAKGKDTASSIGPWLVTTDELAPYLKDGRLHLKCEVRVNGDYWLKDGAAQDAYYTFGDMVERASKDSRIVPGDVIGSGTVGGGSIREAIRKGYEKARFLEPGDVVEHEVEAIGVLRGTIGPKPKLDPGYRYQVKNPAPVPEAGISKDYRYQR